MTTLRMASHIHSAFSDDCDWPLERIASTFHRLGYDGLLVCEHDRGLTEQGWVRIRQECTRLSSPRFVVVPGIEYQDPTHTVHVPVFGDIPFLRSSPEVPEVLRHATAHGGVGVLAHPARRDAFATIQPEWLELASGLEVWSRKYDGIRPNAWALQRADEYDLLRFVSLDFHGWRQVFPLAMKVEVAGEPTATAVVRALRERRVSASAMGLEPGRFGDGPLGGALTAAERTRTVLAPRIRRLEERLRRR